MKIITQLSVFDYSEPVGICQNSSAKIIRRGSAAEQRELCDFLLH